MKITVIGAGSWGTALALHFAHHNNEVALWTRNPDQIRTLQADRENKRGLPGFPFPESLTVHADLGEALKDSQLALIVTSVAGLRSSAELLKQHNAADIPVLAACKGFEQDTGLLTFQVLKEVLPNNKTIGVLSGPSFAQELAAQLPCAVVLASENKDWVEETTAQLNTNVMRLYGSTDVIGVAVGGAVKKRHGDCHRPFRRPRIRPQRTRSLSNTRPCRNHPPSHRHGRSTQNHDGFGRHR